MAKVSPYADPSAHGKITPGLCFKRRGPIVQLGKNPRPKDKKSAAQILQRNKITAAVAKYKILNSDELIFLRRRGSMISKNPYMLYTSSQLKENDWNKTHGHQLQVLNNMVIFDLIQDQPQDIRFSLISSNTKAIRDNIILYTKLDSETAGVVSSVIGPAFTWTGTPNHAPLRFNNGAWSSTVNFNLKANDNGQFFIDNFDEYYISFWTEFTFDVVNGIPQDGQTHYIYNLESQTLPGKFARTALLFPSGTGFQFYNLVNGVTRSYHINNPAVTFNAGEKVFISIAYKKSGIDSEANNLEISFGTESAITKVLEKNMILPSPEAPSEDLTLLTYRSGPSPLKGGLDNIKFIKKVTRKTINEMNDTKNVEEFEIELGYVFDNENIFSAVNEVFIVPELILKIESFSALPWPLPFYWLLAATWSNETTDQRTTNIRFPKIIIESMEAVHFYLSTDMSLYFDQNLIRLGATSNV